MRRWHLFEFEDQPWFPRVLRSHMMSWLSSAYRYSSLPAIWAGYIASALPSSQPLEIVDLASGGAGPLPLVRDKLAAKGYVVSIILTDLHPDPGAMTTLNDRGGPIRYWPEPVDATLVPVQLKGVRTMFTALHHFPPDAASQIFRDAFEKKIFLFVFEGSVRSVGSLAGSLLIPLAVLALTPWVRPFSWSRVLWTYIVPILPVVILWDGVVSQMRTYSQPELALMTSRFSSADYTWEAGEIRPPNLPFALPYVIGRPHAQS
jgi:hypothetical protein